jgi:RNA polymerase sigma factor (sigma-70 family)
MDAVGLSPARHERRAGDNPTHPTTPFPMPAHFPPTSLNLLSKLKAGDDPSWQVSWKRFLELYHEPIEVIARSCYRHHTGGHEPSSGIIEDAVANTVADFFTRGQHRYDKEKGRLRTYLRLLTNARVVDLLRKERPIDQKPLSESDATIAADLPAESRLESEAFHRSLLATLVEDLRNRIPLRQFEIFERVKLKHQSPQFVAEDLGIQRAMVDRNIHKTMTALRELVSHAEYQEEFYE